MKTSIHQQVQCLIQETTDAFSGCQGGLNTDYAGFASMSLAQFKSILNNPNLTGAQLELILRKAMAQNKGADPDQWVIAMAQQISKVANQTV